MRGTLAMLAQPADDKGLELAAQFSPPEAPLGVRGDPVRLRQVVSNLIGNAIKFTERGQVIVRVAQQAAADGAMHIRLRVEDTGIGIAAESREKIFEKFAQVDGSTTRRYGGTGLGLAICQRLLAMMGGRIAVASVLGQGSTFTVDLRLPRSDAPLTEPVPDRHRAVARLRLRHQLHVCDRSAVRLLHDTFDRQGGGKCDQQFGGLRRGGGAGLREEPLRQWRGSASVRAACPATRRRRCDR